MLYCSNCKLLTARAERCMFCGTNKIREPKENDVVYLATKNFFISGMLEELLKNNNIPCLKQGSPDWISMGRISEYTFFVPFGAYEKSTKLLEEFFAEDKQVINEEINTAEEIGEE